MLSEVERIRYARHLMLPELGDEGQLRLKAGRVLLVGVGGLGSPVGLYLAAAGVGHIGLIDADHVEVSNLQRQIMHTSSTLNWTKVESARQRLSDLNPLVDLSIVAVRLTAENADDLVRPYDIVVDATDNYATRYLINDAAVRLGKPLVYGSIARWEGRASVFNPQAGGPCYCCLYPKPPLLGTIPTGVEEGVLGVLPGLIGMIQATEVIKLLTGIGEPLVGRLLLYDALALRFSELRVPRNPGCPICAGILAKE